MPYTPSEIAQLKTLAYHPDLDNVFLALELLKSQAWDKRLSTVLYWLHFRFLWEKESKSANEILHKMRQHSPAMVFLGGLLEWVAEPIEVIFQDYYPRIQQSQLSCEELATALHQLSFEVSEESAITHFLFRFGTDKIRQATLPKLLHKQYTGITALDLHSNRLSQVPLVVFEAENLQELNLDDNQLYELPDEWAHLPDLELLHLTNNQLTALPPSFTQLKKLQRLYIQDNPWNPSNLKAVLSQLPQLNYLSVANTYEFGTPLHHLEALVQRGLLQASEKEQRLFLALEMQDTTALSQLSLLELFEGLKHERTEIRNLARQYLLPLSANLPSAQKKYSIAILGIVSFAVRKHLECLGRVGWNVSNEIEAATTHILLGDFPEQFEAVVERPFVFWTEKEVLAL